MKARIVELRRYLQGWVGYFRLVPLKSFYEDLDKWIRRRMRAVSGDSGDIHERGFVTCLS